MQKNKAGICAILNNVINICVYHCLKFQNDNIYIDNDEFSELFDFPLNLENRGNKHDIEKDFILSNTNLPNAHEVFNKSANYTRLKVFETFFRFKNISDLQDICKKNIDDKTVGLQLRGTDKSTEIKPPNLLKVLNTIEELLKNNSYTKIYLATDDLFLFDIVFSKFRDNLVVLNDTNFSSNSKPLHLSKFRNLSNRQVIRDSYLLSSCPYFFYSFSNVSQFALTLGLKHDQNIFCNNLI